MKEVRSQAKERMKGYCNVCPVCNGKACPSGVPGMGGAGTGASFRANVEALAGYGLRMRLIHDVDEPDLFCSLLGQDLSMPVLAAPIGGVDFNMGADIAELEYQRAVVGACVEKGVLAGTPDGVPPVIHESGLTAIQELGGKGIPFIKPWDDEELRAKLDKAAATGAGIVGMDIDAAGLHTLKLMGRPVFPRGVERLARIIADTPMKFLLKGIMTPEDARLAVEAGAAGIVVSNHGGRVLDFTPGTAEVLPVVAAAVKGKVPILVDGGVRSGVDVLKMLALGADAVLIGRPISVAAVGGLKEGVAKYLDQVKNELFGAMILTGCASIRDISAEVLAGR